MHNRFPDQNGVGQKHLSIEHGIKDHGITALEFLESIDEYSIANRYLC
jgi:hypothetical protein